ncbi:hypothetical protein Emtol_0971 [Emticicia oligotrophica DSM 17448]|uniref:ABC transporter permease n=1 Tax=Emticicia oligotrophica (strain DSM 17448 / CIP 109782 / MTCC 6937 / GPTSA100-15) TaxID=929562 RepID=A0ABM5MYC8_EMTOG|nr:hypothetical protein [Emticicia oligotrophica]AFK02122.1 hypothetical protein Emtol_0971 [Emticicia oligotrophica DSM 17448]
MINIYLKILDFLYPLFNRLGINYYQLRAIVEIKLKMDNRRTRFNQWNKNQHESNSTFYLTLFLYFISSTVFAVFVYASDSVTAVYSVFFAFLMFMIAMSLITDFSSVLLDSNDNAVLLPRPIESKTLLIARITHILMYLLSMMLALSLPTLIITGIKYGLLTAITLFFVCLLALMLVVFLTNILYLTLMKFTSEERLRNIINGFQIFMTFILMGGYRVVGNLIDAKTFTTSVETKVEWWHYMLPPIWMGNSINTVVNHTVDAPHFIFIFLTLTIPFVGLFFLNSGFTNIFSEKIASIDNAKRTVVSPRQVNNKDLVTRLAKTFTRTSIERGAFEFVWKMTARDRKFKLRVYPSLAYLLIYPIFMIGASRGDGTFIEQIKSLEEKKWVALMAVYMCSTILLAIRTQISQTEDFKASWIYQIVPLSRPGEVLSGTLRAVLVKYIFTMCIILALMLGLVWGVNMLDDLCFGILAIINIDLLTSIGMSSELPFSIELKKNGGGNFIKNMLYIVGAGILAIIHYFLMQVPYVIGVFGLLQLALALFLLKKYREVGWEKVTFE